MQADDTSRRSRAAAAGRSIGGAEQADLGILFVHGIGEHARGEALHHMGGSFLRHLTTLEPDAIVGWVRDGSAIAARHRWAGTWRLAEANWDVELALPTFRQTLTWLVLVTPWALQREALFWGLRDSAETSFSASLRSVWRVLTSWQGIAGLFVSILLGPLFQGVLLLVALFRWVPGVGHAIRKILQRVLGDAYQFLVDPAATTHMTHTVSRELERLSERSARCMIVAHSQGAAVSLEALSTAPPPDNFRRLLTLGAGVSKLAAMREVVHRTAFLTTWLVLRLALLPLVIASIGEAADSNHWVVAVGGYLLLGIGPLVGTWTGAGVCAAAVTRAQGLGQRWSWIDVWSRHDLVPDGALAAPEWAVGSGVVTVQVRNVGSWLRSWIADHVTYFANVRQVIPLLHANAVQISSAVGFHPYVPVAWASVFGDRLETGQRHVAEAMDQMFAETRIQLDDDGRVRPRSLLHQLEAAAVRYAPLQASTPIVLPTPRRYRAALVLANLLCLAAIAYLLPLLAIAWLATSQPTMAVVQLLLSPESETLAVAMLVTALATTFHLDRAFRSRWLRRLGVVASTVLVAAIVFGVYATWHSVVPTSRLAEGDCYWYWGGTYGIGFLDSDVLRVPCAELHQAQVLSRLPRAPGPVTDDALRSLGDACADAFAEVSADGGDWNFIYAGEAEEDRITRFDGSPVVCVIEWSEPVTGTRVTTRGGGQRTSGSGG
jgi:hypothetical protein